MTRLLTLLLMFALAFTNGPAVASAICDHKDARAHAAALQSADAAIFIAAHGEEAAAKATSEKAALGDAATALMAGYILPPEAGAFSVPPREPAGRPLRDKPILDGVSVPPLLEPPLA